MVLYLSFKHLPFLELPSWTRLLAGETITCFPKFIFRDVPDSPFWRVLYFLFFMMDYFPVELKKILHTNTLFDYLTFYYYVPCLRCCVNFLNFNFICEDVRSSVIGKQAVVTFDKKNFEFVKEEEKKKFKFFWKSKRLSLFLFFSAPQPSPFPLFIIQKHFPENFILRKKYFPFFSFSLRLLNLFNEKNEEGIEFVA